MPPSASGPELATTTAIADTKVSQAPAPVGAQMPPWARFFSFPVFLAALIIGAAAVTASQDGLPLGKIFAEGDAWWHLAVGEQILATHTFPKVESYSFTAAGTAWIAYGWLPEVLLALTARMGGLAGFSALILFESAAFFLLLYYYAWLRSRHWKAAAVTVAAVLPISGVFVSLRPQLLGYICFVLMLICLELFRAGKRNALWWLGPIYVIWVNSHGTFALGLAVLGFFWAGGLLPVHHPSVVFHQWTRAQRHRLALAYLLSIMALCITPYGTRLASYPFEFSLLQRQVRDIVTEWQPLDVSHAYAQAFILLVLFVFAAQALHPVKYRVEELAFFAGSAWYACIHTRFLIVFALAAVPIFAVICAEFVPAYQPAKDKPIFNAVLIVLLVATIVLVFPSRQALAGAVSRTFPENAVRYLKQNPPRHLWNEDTWGGYLIYVPPGSKPNVFLDGRLDVYKYSGVLSDYLAITGIKANTSFLLDKYAIDALLIHGHRPLITYLLATGKWRCDYADDLAVVLRPIRPGSPPASASWQCQ